MRLDLLHGHGSGNVFPIVDARALALDDPAWAQVARALADRAGPVGGDGLLLLTSGDADHAFGMRMFNADGSEAETCLNGLRLVARLGFERLGIEAARARLKTSDAAVARAPELAVGVATVRERVGPAILDTAAFPIRDASATLDRTPLPLLSPTLAFTAVAMPNPHLIAFVGSVDERELVRIGEVCEAAPDWLPNRANVSFVEVRGPDALFVRTFERGVGLTDSCGSAMAAATVAAALAGHIDWSAEITVFNRGGMVRARVDADRSVTIAGNATFKWAGSVEVDVAQGIARDLVVTERYPAEVAAWEALRAAL